MLILIKGAGDLASGIGWRLFQCGHRVIMTETARPTTVRCAVAFSRAVYEASAEVEGVTGRLAKDAGEAIAVLDGGELPVLADPAAAIVRELPFDAVVDAILAKRNLGTALSDASVVVGVGPGFRAGTDCHAVVETQRGHNLGRVYYSGSAAPNTGVPGTIGGYTTERILRASADGVFHPVKRIGQLVKQGELVATVDGAPVYALIGGVVRGMLPAGTPVHKGMKAGDIDPRGIVSYCSTISDKSRAIAGGVLEAVLHLHCKKEARI